MLWCAACTSYSNGRKRDYPYSGVTNVRKQNSVFVICPDCHKYYIQLVNEEFIGPRKRVPNYLPEIQDRAKEAGQREGKDVWVGLMRCAECSLRLAPPILREALQKWLGHGEIEE